MKLLLALLLATTSFAANQNAAMVRTVYSVTPVTTAAYVELVASTAYVVNHISVFDSSGQVLKLATGPVGAEVDAILIPPGGADLPFKVSAGTRLSIKAVSGNATSGEQDLNLFY
jgi:uncharacterized protein YcgI (DUF1989 family)